MAGVSLNVSGFDIGDNLDQSSKVQAVVDTFGPSDLSKVAADFDARSRRASEAAAAQARTCYGSRPENSRVWPERVRAAAWTRSPTERTLYC